MFGQQLAPVTSGFERLVASPEVGGLLGPFDGEVDLADFRQRLGRVLQPGGNLPILGVRADDRVDVMVEHREPLRVPFQGEPLMGVR